MTEQSLGGVEPKRRRGHLRVAAIMATAGDLFAERGYDAVTMTEIAAQSGTAIGSLYRFFPTKEVLADALLSRYGDRIAEELEALVRDARDLPPDSVADALVDHALAWAPDRAAALVLIEAREFGGAQREKIRATMRQRFGETIAAINPALPPDAAGAKAKVLQQLFKLAAANAGEGEVFAREMRLLVRLYLREQAAG